MKRVFPIYVWFVLIVGFGLCGCNQMECGPGTYESLGACIPSEQTLCGEGTVYERGYCVIEDAASGLGPTPVDVSEDIRDVENNEE